MINQRITAFPNKIDSILFDVLNKYSKSGNKGQIEEFISDFLLSSTAYDTKEKAESVARDISLAVDAIRLGYEAIQEYKSRGLSNGVWLRDTLDAATSSMQQEEKNLIIHSVKQAMALNNAEFTAMLTTGEVQGSWVPELGAGDFRGLEKTGIAQNLKEEIEANSLLGAISVEGFCQPPNIEYPQLDIVKEYFEARLDVQSDGDFKKVVAAGIEIAKEQGLLPEKLASWSTDELAAVVDKGLSGAKLAYKAAQGEIDVTDATDYLIDRSVSTVGTVVTTTCATYGTAAGGAIGGILGSLFGPAGTAFGTKIGSTIGRYAGKFVGDVVIKGVKKVARAAIGMVEKTWESGKRAASWVGDKVSAAWKWATSWW
ncbi:MAG: hypothetical protein LHW56_08560 [Candidatus Cloacimonetes bacterium]|nr:hypothetical protein [Candidatus Cloacimonadota bacterium]MDY0172946.1 hypothetical protein [Candidatus Cloacimonadaceae bacterium]